MAKGKILRWLKINTAEGESAQAWGPVLFIVLAGPNSVSLMSSDVLHFLISHLVSADVSVYCTLWQLVCVCVTCLCMCLLMYVCMCVSMHIYVDVCIYTCMCVFVCTHMPEISPRTLSTLNSYTIRLAQINFQVWRHLLGFWINNHSQMNIVTRLEILNIFWSSLTQRCLVAVCQRTILWKIEFSTPVEFCTLSDKRCLSVYGSLSVKEAYGERWRREGGRRAWENQARKGQGRREADRERVILLLLRLFCSAHLSRWEGTDWCVCVCLCVWDIDTYISIRIIIVCEWYL